MELNRQSLKASLGAFLLTCTLATTGVVHADNADGACDGYTGAAGRECQRAHWLKNRLDMLEVSGKYPRAILRVAARLAGSESTFTSLTGQPVPGFGPVCELQALNNWVNANETIAPVYVDASGAYATVFQPDVEMTTNTSQTCALQYNFNSDYVSFDKSAYVCTKEPTAILTMDPDYGSALTLNTGFLGFEWTGILRICEGYYPLDTTEAVDQLKLQACALSLGCSNFGQ